MQVSAIFRKLATKISYLIGTPKAFIFAVALIAVWFASGALFDYSDTWQLLINTFTTITTFLIVILIQNTQNRDSKATHIKLDELLKGTKGASDSLINLEEMPDNEIDELQMKFRELHEKYQKELARRQANKSK